MRASREEDRTPAGFASVTKSLRLFVAFALFLAACSADDGGDTAVDDPGTTESESDTAEADDAAASDPLADVVLGTSVPDSVTRPLALTEPLATPEVDTSVASVPLEEVVFDLFNGSSLPLSEATPDQILGLFDRIAPIDAPEYESATAAAEWLIPDDLIVGYVDDDGGAWAYPVRILNSREIVNDELGGQPLVITYCPLCGSGVVFSRELDGELITLSNTSALFENDMVMVDRETGSYWWQVAGEAIVGPLTGSFMETLPAQTTSWESWVSQYPDTAVMARDGRDYSTDIFAGYAEVLDAGRTPFPVSDGVFDDDRLAPSARVIVATINGESRAWATSPARTVEDEVGWVAVRLVMDGVGGAITDAEGTPLPSASAFWFSVVSAYPDIDLG